MIDDTVTDKQPAILTISVPCAPSQLAVIRKFVEEAALRLVPTLSQEALFALKVAVSEACANAIEHAQAALESNGASNTITPAESGTDGDKSQSTIVVTASLESERLQFSITDQGIFRPPRMCQADCESRGLGLPLMISLMDEVRFEKTAKGGTRVTLVVNVVPPADANNAPQQEIHSTVQTRQYAQPLYPRPLTL